MNNQSTFSKPKLDSKDKKILKILNKNARLSIAEISRKTGIQRDSVLYRVNRLKKTKVIKFFHTALNPSAIGYEIYSYVVLSLHNFSPKKEKELTKYMNNNKNIVYVAKTTGRWDFIINIVAENLKQFDEIIKSIRMKFSDIIKEYETSSIIEEYKYDSMADLIIAKD